MRDESNFQKSLKQKIKDRYDGSMVLKNDPSNFKGIPDLLILYKDKWAALECKASPRASERPGQGYYISKMNSMSYASFINPENEEQVFKELDDYFDVR